MGAALIATGVSAQQAIVKNNCKSTVYVQSFPYDGSAAGPLTTLSPGQAFAENFRPSGSVSFLPGLYVVIAKQTNNMCRPLRSRQPKRSPARCSSATHSAQTLTTPTVSALPYQTSNLPQIY